MSFRNGTNRSINFKNKKIIFLCVQARLDDICVPRELNSCGINYPANTGSHAETPSAFS